MVDSLVLTSWFLYIYLEYEIMTNRRFLSPAAIIGKARPDEG